MAISCDPNALMQAAACLRCIPQGDRGAVMISLLCQLSSGPRPIEAGVATLSGGSVTVFSKNASVNNSIIITEYSPGSTTQNPLAYGSIVEGVSFVISSSTGTDNSKVSWVIFKL